jgi:hypothetical protein
MPGDLHEDEMNGDECRCRRVERKPGTAAGDCSHERAEFRSGTSMRNKPSAEATLRR